MNNQKIIEARKILMEYLRNQAKEKGISTYRIAELTGYKQPNVHRMLSGEHPITLDNFITLCDVLNSYVFVIDKEADDDLAETMRNRYRRPGDEG
jgi:transcriptional regulator with XRE-family HTH domain